METILRLWSTIVISRPVVDRNRKIGSVLRHYHRLLVNENGNETFILVMNENGPRSCENEMSQSPHNLNDRLRFISRPDIGLWQSSFRKFDWVRDFGGLSLFRGGVPNIGMDRGHIFMGLCCDAGVLVIDNDSGSTLCVYSYNFRDQGLYTVMVYHC